MARLFISVLLSMVASTAIAQSRSWDILRDSSSPSVGGSTDVQMRPRYDPDPTATYRGTIDSDGSTRLRNLDGDTLRGSIDSDGSGRLRDSDGNSYRVRPR